MNWFLALRLTPTSYPRNDDDTSSLSEDNQHGHYNTVLVVRDICILSRSAVQIRYAPPRNPLRNQGISNFSGI